MWGRGFGPFGRLRTAVCPPKTATESDFPGPSEVPAPHAIGRLFSFLPGAGVKAPRCRSRDKRKRLPKATGTMQKNGSFNQMVNLYLPCIYGYNVPMSTVCACTLSVQSFMSLFFSVQSLYRKKEQSGLRGGPVGCSPCHLLPFVLTRTSTNITSVSQVCKNTGTGDETLRRCVLRNALHGSQ